jgi:RecA/RadA recombinase
MATKPKTPAAEKTETVTAADPRVQLTKYLNGNRDDHYNHVPDIAYHVSTGSLALDREIGGGLGVGVHRLVGPPGAGKSSEALEIARNFLATVPNSRVVYVKSEGRLSDNMRARSGLTFTKRGEDWAVGTVFIFECNIYETIIGLFRDLILNNGTDCRYLFIVDSADAVNLKNDLLKDIGTEKVAGGPLLTKRFLQKFALAMAKFGHMCLYLGQISTNIQLDPYGPKGPVRQVSGGGGTGVQHFANEVLEYQEWYEGDLILPDPDARVDRIKNRPLGHTVRIKLKKDDKENRYITVEIPIRHGQTNGTSIWREREVGDEMLAWHLVSKTNPNPPEEAKGKKPVEAKKTGGSWLYFAPQLAALVAEQGMEPLPEKVQGMPQLYALLEERGDVTQLLYKRFREMIAGAATVSTVAA